VNQSEGGAGDVFFGRSLKAMRDSLNQRGFPGAEVPAQEHKLRRRK